MKKLISKVLASLLIGLSLASGAHAAAGGIEWDKFPKEKMQDMAALQNGAKLFVNYCLNCHSAAFMRYNRLRDLGPDGCANQEQSDVCRRQGGRHDESVSGRQAGQGLFGATPLT